MNRIGIIGHGGVGSICLAKEDLTDKLILVIDEKRNSDIMKEIQQNESLVLRNTIMPICEMPGFMPETRAERRAKARKKEKKK